ncbi:MAG TPA: NAD(P)H-dependent oxidoreductase [Steroidobacter sp.]|uniref:NADPH-dependent FMN reductase n=1 Tax=Steroidobacter sp. TaxID=1978227 RepID=UPI002EDA0A83
MRNIGFIVGSLRKGAYTRLLSQAVVELAPQSFKLTEIGIGEMPLYNQDLETATPPTQWVTFRNQVKSADAIIFITPEYNRGLPGALKNAIDVGSRPMKESVWKGKPAMIMSLTPGKLGAMAAHQQLRLGLSVIGVPVMPLPELYLAGAGDLFDGSGKLVNEDTRKHLASALNDFDTWIGRFK